MAKKVKQYKAYKGFIIAESEDAVPGAYKFEVYTKDEWAMGSGYRTAEWEADNMKECKEFIDCY